ncbi:hypothetical protein JTE90_014152 [Oedothorax gibbosus]|uniref:Uncharacterized protein n=1 Tax=Oedothorax gibbosus TaxID=931172 RepID=A0AAV6VLN7_9ARAC|nr:hypothetical protein JTE90_014152 [Oedothorax gibbosus]
MVEISFAVRRKLTFVIRHFLQEKKTLLLNHIIIEQAYPTHSGSKDHIQTILIKSRRECALFTSQSNTPPVTRRFTARNPSFSGHKGKVTSAVVIESSTKPV